MPKRIEYIDAMRGFAMIAVVFSHVGTFQLFGFDKITPLQTLVQTFFLSLFFFVSGYVTNIDDRYKEQSSLCEKLLKKCKSLLLPTFIIGIIYVYFFLHTDIIFLLFNPAKAGYWFPISLLEMFVITHIVTRLFNQTETETKKIDKSTVVLIILALVMYLAKLPMKTFPLLNTIGDITCLHYTCYYFPYFILGYVIKRYQKLSDSILKNSSLRTFILITFFVIWYIKVYCLSSVEVSTDTTWKVVSTLVDTVSEYCGLLVVYCYFQTYQIQFTSSTRLGNFLQFLGRRTLDIYLLHYFFLLPIPSLGVWMENNPNIVIELLIGIILSLLIVGCCLLISQVLRISDFLAYWLFNTKKQKYQIATKTLRGENPLLHSRNV